MLEFSTHSNKMHKKYFLNIKISSKQKRVKFFGKKK